jgi:hypothetical protein
MRNLCLIAMLLAAVLSQQVARPVLVYNGVARTAMLENGKEVCDQKEVENIVEDVYDNGYFVYVLNARTYIASSFPGNYSESATVQAAVKDALAAKGTAVTKSDANSSWDAKNPLRNTQSLVFASSTDGDSVDYYHFEFHLNLQGRMIGTTESYLKAHKYLACQAKNEWIQKYFA